MALTNATSLFLKPDENKNIEQFMGPKCVTISTAVVRCYKTNAPAHDLWEKVATGVALLVRDSKRHSYFIKVMCPIKKDLFMEQELYSKFSFKMFKNHFMSFEGNLNMIGLCFADESEAEKFKLSLEEKLLSREQRRKPAPSGAVHATILVPNEGKKIEVKKEDIKKDDKKDKKKGTIRAKIVISNPCEFRHVGHIGFDPKKGFDLNNVDKKWKTLFDHIGINDALLKDVESSKFIFDFVQERGGIDKAVMEIEEAKKKPTSQQISAPIPISQSQSTIQTSSNQPSVPQSLAPRPPRKSMSSKAAQKEIYPDFPEYGSTNQQDLPLPPLDFPAPTLDFSGSPTVYSAPLVAPPAPPPLPVLSSVAPPLFTVNKNTSERSSNSSIKIAPVDERGNLMNQIRSGLTLKKSESIEKPIPKKQDDGIAGALASRLAEMRSRVVEDDDECDVDNDEWED